MKQHIEFRDTEHFRERYQRIFPGEPLSQFIDFFWQTDFESVLQENPEGFSDLLFPNTGYTYIINLGSPFIMQVNRDKFRITSKSDNFLPRHEVIECFHSEGCCIFGIKFKISPILLEKKVNFSEYRNSMNPLSYLIDRSVIKAVRESDSFRERVNLLSGYFLNLIGANNPPAYISIVTGVLKEFAAGKYSVPVEELAENHNISVRTLQRYFEQAMSLGTKQTLQIFRIRHAVESIAKGNPSFLQDHGYYDQSHFIRHLKKFTSPRNYEEIYRVLKP